MSHPTHIAARLPSPEQLQSTVDTLELAGFDRAQFGVLGLKSLFKNDAKTDEAAFQTNDAIREPESAGALGGMLIGGLIYAGAVIAAGSVILAGGGLGVALLAGVASGTTGGLLGVLTAHGFEDSYALLIEKQIVEGGVVLWVSPRDDHQRCLAEAELAKAGAVIVRDSANISASVLSHV